MGVSVARLPIEQIRRDGGTQARERLIESAITRYADMLNAGKEAPAVRVYYDGTDYWLGDGFHRVETYARAGRSEIQVEIERGTQRDAVFYALGCNTNHGEVMTTAERKKAALTILRDPEWSEMSNRQIAQYCGVSHSSVAIWKKEITGRSSSDTSPQKKKYKDRWGNEATMDTSGISEANRARCAPSAPLANPHPAELFDDAATLGLAPATLGVAAPRSSRPQAAQAASKKAPVAVTEGAPSVAPIDEAEAHRRALEALKADVRAVCGGWLAQLRVLGVASDALSDVLDPTLGLVAAVEAAIVGGPTEAIVAAWVSIEGRGTIGGGEISSDLDQGSTSSGHTDQRDGGLGEERADQERCSPAKARREAEKAVYAEQAEQVVALWGEVYDRPSVALKPDSKSGKLRRKAVVARLKEGYPLEDVLDAVRGCALSPYHMGQNPEGTPHNDLTTICRDGGQIEKFSDLYRNGEKRRTLTPSHSGQRPDHHCNERWKNPDGSWKSGDEAAEGWDFEYWEQKGAIYSGGSNSGGYGG